jgi:hypothetical protein
VVSSRDEFAAFLERVLTDYRTSGRDEWENTTWRAFSTRSGPSPVLVSWTGTARRNPPGNSSLR